MMASAVLAKGWDDSLCWSSGPFVCGSAGDDHLRPVDGQSLAGFGIPVPAGARDRSSESLVRVPHVVSDWASLIRRVHAALDTGAVEVEARLTIRHGHVVRSYAANRRGYAN